MTQFADSPIAKQAVATATVNDCYAGELRAFLIPQRTTRAGKRVTVYRWLDQRGFCCDGLRCGFPADRMIAKANSDRRFSNITAA